MSAGHTEGLKASDASGPEAGERGKGPVSFSRAPTGGKQVSVRRASLPEVVLFSLSVQKPERGREGAAEAGAGGIRQLPSRSRRLKNGSEGPGRPR